MTAPRVLVAELFHEGHSFTSLGTGRSGFAVAEGLEMIDKARTSSSILGGAVRALEERGAACVPSISAVAAPGGAVDEIVFEDLKSQIVSAAVSAEPDAVLLSLHGAMLTQAHTDPEGALIAELREALGPRIPIAVALDLHAHITPKMLEGADICLTCKENPHSDFPDTGRKAATLLLDFLAGRIRPAIAAVWVPLVVGARMETGEGPLKAVHDLCRQMERASATILDISIANTTAYLDAPEAGQTVVVTTNDNSTMGEKAAIAPAAELWRRRDDFRSDRPSLEAVFEQHFMADRPAGPLIIGDQGDRVLAGAPGDDPQIMDYARRAWPALRILAPLTDPDAVERAVAAGCGGRFRAAIGGGFSSGVAPIEAEWRVVSTGDGHFVQDGPFLAGEAAELGQTAVLEAGNITVMATAQAGFTQDPNAFRSNGLELEAFDVIVSKSGYHFKLSFGAIGPCVVADTPGLTNYKTGRFPFALRRPVYPEDDLPPFDPVARSFPPSTISG